MAHKKATFFLLITIFSINIVLAQSKTKPTVIVKKEFCPPEELLDEGAEGTEEPEISENGINEPMMKKCLSTLSYSSVVSKLNNKYTIIKWKYTNRHNEKQTDTIIIITDKGLNDRFVFYKTNKSAGKSQPILMDALVGSKVFMAGPFKVGMAQLMADRALNGKNDMNKEETVYYIKDEPQNSYFNFSFENGLLRYIGYVGYWD